MKTLALLVFSLLAIGCSATDTEMIDQYEFDGSPPAYGMQISIPPYGEGHVFAPDTTKESKELLREFRPIWQALWPKINSKIEDAAKEYNVDTQFDPDSFYVSIQTIGDGEFMSDKASIMIGVHPSIDTVPAWHFFLDGAEIKHFQPVY